MAAFDAIAQVVGHPLTGPAEAAAAVTTLLRFVGEDPTREGLTATPGRVVRAWQELTEGYAQDPAAILSVQFKTEGDEMVVVRDVPFSSLCEHHLLPFHGTVTLGYVPGATIVGLSKVARLVRCYSRRLQVQERMTAQIGVAFEMALKPVGVGVYVRAHHTCQSMRGVQSQGSMTTSWLAGVFRSKAEARAEFLAAARGA